MARGGAWMMVFRLVDRGSGVVIILMLSRLLLPEHFGVVALASSVVSFIELMSIVRLDTSLIQSTNLTRAHYDTAWTMQNGLTMGCALVLCAAAALASRFCREPRPEAAIRSGWSSTGW